MKYKNAVPVIATDDIRSTTTYYSRVLGFAEHFVFGEPPVYAGVERDGVLLYVSLDVKMASTLIFERLNCSGQRRQSRIERLGGDRLLRRFYAATGAKLREISERLDVRHLVNLTDRLVR
jgi:hypothetical protein